MAKVHLIGNAHLDPVWMWRWTEGYSEVLATFRSALDRMNEYPDYIFTCAGAAYYSWVEETDPEMFEEIRQRVKEGRWVIVGGWWIQPDCNAPAGESFARHALYSQRYYLEKFGVKAEVGYNVDSFGHAAMLPQLLKEGGMRAYVFMRPNPFEEMSYPFPTTSFLWQSPDGSTVPTFRISGDTYCASNTEQTVRLSKEALARSEEHGIPDMCFYGVGNHGGGPTISLLNGVIEAMESGELTDCAFSSPNAFFDELDQDKLPLFPGELQHHASGCYTTIMEIKELNREAEYRLMAAEKYASLAAWLGCPVDTDGLTVAWKSVLFNQFHDIMGGCCIREAAEDAITDLRHAIHVAQQVTNRALQKLNWNMDTSRGQTPVRSKEGDSRLWRREDLGTPMTVFNPHSWPVTVPVRTGGDFCGDRIPQPEETDGKLVPHQKARSSLYNGLNDRWESLFLAEIPAMGWKTYWLKRDRTEKAPVSARSLTATDTHLENDFLSVDFDPATGAIVRMVDKVRGKEMLKAPTAALVIDETDSDTWAHKIFEFRNVAGEFGQAEVKLVAMGDVYARIRVTTHYNTSSIQKDVTLYRELPGLYVSYVIQWHEAHRMLKFAFPTTYTGGEVSGIPGGALKRAANGKEQPMQNWVSLGDFAVVTDSRAAYDALDGEIRLTVLRSPAYADHYATRDEFCEIMEQGEHRFEMMILAENDSAELARRAAELICPPERIMGTYHEGRLAETDGFLTVTGDVLVDVMKKSEDGTGWILRLREAKGAAVEAEIDLKALGRAFTASFTPWQIRTFFLTEDGLRETNFLEE